MNLSEEQNKLVIKYAQGEMDVAELTAFEAQLQRGDEISTELLNELETFNIIKGTLKSAIQKITDYTPITEDLKNQHEDIWKLIQEVRDNRDWIEQIIKDAFKVDEPPEKQPESLVTGFYFYKEGSYKNAIDTFTLRGEQDDDEGLSEFYMHYYSGISYLKDVDAAKAVNELEESISLSPNDLWKMKAQWYLALAYLKTNNIEKAQALLKEVEQKEIKENDIAKEYNKKANDLLNELKNKQ